MLLWSRSSRERSRLRSNFISLFLSFLHSLPSQTVMSLVNLAVNLETIHRSNTVITLHFLPIISLVLGYSKNAKEIRRAKVYKQIQQLASQLNLSQYHVEAAKRLFNMAQDRNFELGHDRNFTQGRPTSHVIAAALYITCRLEKTPHLLIDFSDALQVGRISFRPNTIDQPLCFGCLLFEICEISSS